MVGIILGTVIGTFIGTLALQVLIIYILSLTGHCKVGLTIRGREIIKERETIDEQYNFHD